MTSKIHVALCFDTNFWAPAYAVMRSICLSTSRRKELVFHLLHMPLTAEQRTDLEGIVGEFGSELAFYPLGEMDSFGDFVAGLPRSGRWPSVVYARLMLPDLLPQTVERVIYLDCDTLVRAPIEQLYAADLGGQPLGAVQEALSPFIPLRRDMRENADIFDGAEPYFNSGVLVIDLAQWRTLDMKAQIGALEASRVLSRLYFDQDMLNLIFRERWQALSWRWNTIDAHQAHEALNPAILHFTQASKPWHLTAGILHSTAYARWYRHVMTNKLFYRFAAHRRRRWLRRLLRLER
ncbi:Lipopolysaccharide biosynthesis protein, LPS:glycosyltransferase [Devosia lucknowensis]|uniref:Lipopolysaccharide biosynthesis protein, LPS:glycosyltransferase n=1 Tax=Devosia lucknowensis TaxID=1096929 RepID=A0A1Y6G6J5_9HYPH|nr:glycosyltransferase family 8 protein [Devosia lucknowensis]SMQ85716.1 Lipopolysaccharide biosynthesis protein, LPS:glycosyltransferase [Devosia lucknowensis]